MPEILGKKENVRCENSKATAVSSIKLYTARYSSFKTCILYKLLQFIYKDV